MSKKIIVVISRPDENDATKLEGFSAITSVMQSQVSQRIETSDAPVVSLRCDNAAEIAWNLAGIMAAVRHIQPEAYTAAFPLMAMFNMEQPIFTRKLDEEQ